MTVHQVVTIEFVENTFLPLVAFNGGHGAYHMTVAVMLLVVRGKEGDSERLWLKNAHDLSDESFDGALRAFHIHVRTLDGYIGLERSVRASRLGGDVDREIAVVLETVARVATGFKEERVELSVWVQSANTRCLIDPPAPFDT